MGCLVSGSRETRIKRLYYTPSADHDSVGSHRDSCAGVPAVSLPALLQKISGSVLTPNPSMRSYITGGEDNDRLNDELNPSVQSTYLIIKENPGKPAVTA